MLEHRLAVVAVALVAGCHARPTPARPRPHQSAYLLVEEAGAHHACAADVARQPAPAIAKLEASILARRTVYIPSESAGRCDAWDIVDAPNRSGLLVRTEERPDSDGASRVITTHRKPFLFDRVCQSVVIDGESTQEKSTYRSPEGIGPGQVSTGSSCISDHPLRELNETRARFGEMYWYFQSADCERDVRAKQIVAAQGERGGC